MLDIFIPTYKRPQDIEKVADNIKATTTTPYTLTFGVELDDYESKEKLTMLNLNWLNNKYDPGFANTVQTLYEATNEPCIFVGNDDFDFLPNWDVSPIGLLENNPNLMVVGLNDGYPGTRYYTIHMIRRSYIKDQSGVVDMPDRVFYPYNHNYIDTEFTETAIKRGVWSPASAPCIIHEHPEILPALGRTKAIDPTYKKNMDKAGADAMTYDGRRHLFI